MTCPHHNEMVEFRYWSKDGKLAYRCTKLSKGGHCGHIEPEVSHYHMCHVTLILFVMGVLNHHKCVCVYGFFFVTECEREC